MAWFTRKKPGVAEQQDVKKTIKTEGLWQKCVGCNQIIWAKTLDENLQVCPQCGYHFRIRAKRRM